MLTACGMPRIRLYTTVGQYLRVVADFLTGRWKRGNDVALLEKQFSEQMGGGHAIMMPMARVGIYLVLRTLISPGQKVILSPYTIADVINMVICAGGVPVFADIERETCNIDTKQVKTLLDSSEHSDVGAVLATHFYGLACDGPGLRDLCAEYGVPLIEDCAQALSAEVAGKPVGTFGAAAVYSFGLYKNVNSFYGGMVLTKDDNLAADLRESLSEMPMVRPSFYLKKVVNGLITDVLTWPLFYRIFTFRLFRFGLEKNIDAINNQTKIDVDPDINYEVPTDYLHRPSPLQARLAMRQLPGVDAMTRQRIANADMYRDGLKGIPELILPPEGNPGEHIYWYFPIQSERREELVLFAMRAGRDMAVSYHRNCSALPCFGAYARVCPRAEKTANAVIYLPCYPMYSAAEIEENIRVIKRYFEEA